MLSEVVFLPHLQAQRPMRLRGQLPIEYWRWLLLCKHQHELLFQPLRLLLLVRSLTRLGLLLQLFHYISDLSLHWYHLLRLQFLLPIRTLFLQFLLLDFIFLSFLSFERDLLFSLHLYALLIWFVSLCFLPRHHSWYAGYKRIVYAQEYF